MNISPTAVLTGYLILGSFILSPSSIQVPKTDWEEPVLLWMTIAMPTGSGKSTLFRHLYNLLQRIRSILGIAECDPTWVLDDASFEKMGALMHLNASRLLGLFDEFSACKLIYIVVVAS